jgi:hypothetical protein
MASAKVDAVQPKGSTKAEVALETQARALLAAVLPRSIRERREYGAVMCRNNSTGALSATRLRSSSDSDSAVDVGLSEPNCGCPEGTTPVAFYHTHPHDRIVGANGSVLHFDQDFSDIDRRLANDQQIVAFLGSYDGKFRRYAPPELPSTLVDGKRVLLATDAEGNVLPERFSTPVILNGTLPTR